MATTREILAGRAAVELSLRDKLKAGLDAAQQRLQRFAVSVAAIGISFQSVQAMASRAMGLIEQVFTGPADQLQNLADRTGLSVEMLQSLAESGADSGATLEDVGGAARSMANFLQQAERGGSGAAQSLADLGVSAGELAGMSQDQRLSRFADALAGIDDPARRAALAQDIFGRGAMSLLPVLAGGSKAMEAYRKRLEEIGALRTADQIAAADELGDSFGRLGRRLQAVGFSALAAMAPMLQKITDAAVGVVEVFNQFIQASPALAQTLGVVAVATIGATVGLAMLTGATLAASAAAYAASVAWGVATAAVGAFSAVMAIVASPVGIVVGLAVALVAALAVLGVTLLLTTESGQVMVAGFMAGFKTLLDFTKQAFGGIFDALAAGNLKLAGEVAMAGLFVAWTAGWGKIKEVTASAMAWLGGKIIDGFTLILTAVTKDIDTLLNAWNMLAEKIGGTKLQLTGGLLAGAGGAIKAGLNAGASVVADEARQATADAKAELDALTAQAEAERKKREDALKVPRIGGDGRDGDGDRAPDIAQHLAKQISGGTFSATTVGGLAQSTRTEKIWGDMVDLQRSAEEHLAFIAKKLEGGEPLLVGG